MSCPLFSFPSPWVPHSSIWCRDKRIWRQTLHPSLIFSSYAVYIQFYCIHLLIQVQSVRLPVDFTVIQRHATANCIHLVTLPSASLSLPCSIVYLLGFLQSNQHSLSPPFLLLLPNTHSFTLSLSLPPRYFSQRWISTHPPTPIPHPLSSLCQSLRYTFEIRRKAKKNGHEENTHILNRHTPTMRGTNERERVIMGMC